MSLLCCCFNSLNFPFICHLSLAFTEKLMCTIVLETAQGLAGEKEDWFLFIWVFSLCSDPNSVSIDFVFLNDAKLRGTRKKVLPKPPLCFSFTACFICIFILYRQSAAIFAVGFFICTLSFWQAAFHSITTAYLRFVDERRYWFG